METCRAETKDHGGVEVCGSDYRVKEVSIRMVFGTVRTWLCQHHREQFRDFGCEVTELEPAAQAEPAPPTSTST
jgi:hypothetical protein